MRNHHRCGKFSLLRSVRIIPRNQRILHFSQATYQNHTTEMLQIIAPKKTQWTRTQNTSNVCVQYLLLQPSCGNTESNVLSGSSVCSIRVTSFNFVSSFAYKKKSKKLHYPFSKIFLKQRILGNHSYFKAYLPWVNYFQHRYEGDKTLCLTDYVIRNHVSLHHCLCWGNLLMRTCHCQCVSYQVLCCTLVWMEAKQ